MHERCEYQIQHLFNLITVLADQLLEEEKRGGISALATRKPSMPSPQVHCQTLWFRGSAKHFLVLTYQLHSKHWPLQK